MSYLQLATRISYLAHSGQVDKAGQPYYLHPVRVSARVLRDGGSHDEVAAALLHDVVEDTPWTLDDLHLVGFSARTLDLVDLLTFVPEHETRDEYLHSIRNDPGALRVKLADVADNSDAVRLDRLPVETAERLRKKYVHTLHLLTDEPEPESWLTVSGPLAEGSV